MFKISIIPLLFLLLSTQLLWAQAAANFDGRNDKATVYHHNDFNLSTHDFTVEAIVRDVALGKSMLTIISKRDLFNNGFALMIDTYKGMKLIAEIGKDKYEVNTSVFEEKGCHSVGFSRSGDNITLFIDDKAYPFNGKPRNISTTENLLIGDDGSNTHNPFNGYIEEVRFWNVARSDNQIFDWNHKCIAPSTSGLLALWNIEENAGQFFHDVASVQHHAYLGSGFNSDNRDPLWTSNECLESCCDGRAIFTVSNQTPLAAQWVNFTNSSINAATYEWSVNNQVVSTNQHLQYSFGMGVSIVHLRVNSEKDCYSYYSMAIEVTNVPELCKQPSQTISDCSPDDLNNPNTPLLVRDNWGNCFTPESLALPAPSNSRSNNPNYPPGQVCDCGHFRLFFKDVIDNRQEVNPISNVLEGYGFNAPVDGAMRRTSLCRVYEDISVLLNTTLPSTEKVRIEVRQSGDASNALMDAGVLGLGGTYFIDMDDVFSHGEVARTIIKGEDSYKNLQYYNSNFATIPHGTIRFRFDTNWNFDLSVNPPLATSSQREFYSVALHEAIHSLGFVSLISSNGNSVLAGNGTPLLYTVYDSYLMNSTSGNPLISNTSTSSGGYTCTNILPNLGIISACPTFNGTYANNSNHPTYFDLSAGFEPGSSLSHFNCSAPFSNAYIMNKAYTPNRRPNIAEVEALCDIGYTTSGIYGQNISSTNNTFATYNNSCAHPCQVIGTNDVVIPGTATSYTVCRTTANCGGIFGEITIPDVLTNDNGAGNLPTGYDCLTIHIGGGQFTTTTTNGFTYEPDPLFGGWATLSYVPTCTSGGITTRGSRAYVLIYVEYPPDPTCEVYAPNDCNLVCNGDFEGYNWWRVYSRQSNLDNFAFQNITSLRNARTIICFNNGNPYLHFMTSNEFKNNLYSPTDPMNGITLELSKPLLPGESAVLTFKSASLPNIYGDNPALEIYGSEFVPCAGLGNNNSISCGNSISSCTQYNPFCISNQVEISNHLTGVPDPSGNSCGYYTISNYNYNTYTVNFTNTSSTNINHLVIGRSVFNNTCCVKQGRVILDDVELHKTNAIAVPMNITTTVSNPSPCVGTTTSITYDICFDAAYSANISSLDLSHNLFGSTTMTYGSGGDFDANGQKTLQLSDFTFNAGANTYCISLTQELDITGSINQAEDILLNIDAGEMCLTSATVAQSLNQITPVQPLNSVTTLSISPNQTTANVGDIITYTVQMCNNSTAVPPNGDLTGITLDILPQAGLTYNFTAPFSPPYTFDLVTGVCSTFTFTATVTSDCIAPTVEVAATSSCIPYSQQANPVSIGGGGSVDFPVEAENTAHTDATIFTATAIGNNDEVYSVGIFSNDISFIDGVNTNTLVKNHNCASLFSPFLVKYGSCGFEWAVEIPVCNFIDLKAGPDVEIGQNGAIYVAFSFVGSFTMNGATYTSQGNTDIAIIKYDATGTPIWVKTEGGIGEDLVTDIETYYNGTNEEIFIVGSLFGSAPNTVLFSNTTTVNYNNLGNFCSGCSIPGGITYAASYTDNGPSTTINWVNSLSNTATFSGKLSVDPIGNVYVIGMTNSSFTFNGSTIGALSTSLNEGPPSSTNLDFDLFVLKYNHIGTEIWAEMYGSDKTDILAGMSEGRPFGFDIQCEGTTHLGILLPSTGLSSSGGTQPYMTNYGTHLLRLNSSNGSLDWVEPIANPSLSAGNLAGNFTYFCNLDINGSNYLVNGSFLLDNPNSLPVPGTGFSSIDFHGNTINYTSMSSYPAYNDYQGAFTANFNNTGTLQWVNTNTTITPIAPAVDRYATLVNLDIETDNSGNIYTPFYLKGTATLNTNNITGGVTGNQDVVDGFISRIDGTTGNYLRPSMNSSSLDAQDDLTTTGDNNQTLETTTMTTTSNLSTKLYPNPTTGKVTLEIKSDRENNKVEQIIIYDVTGRKVQEISTQKQQSTYDLNLNSQQSGVYFVEMLINQELITKRVILMK